MVYQLQQNYLLPVNKIFQRYNKDISYTKEEIEDILTQQVLISQLSNGISYSDTENMDEYERIFIFKKLIDMKKEELEARKNALAEAKRNQ